MKSFLDILIPSILSQHLSLKPLFIIKNACMTTI
jgi:hypothetical protein